MMKVKTKARVQCACLAGFLVYVRGLKLACVGSCCVLQCEITTFLSRCGVRELGHLVTRSNVSATCCVACCVRLSRLSLVALQRESGTRAAATQPTACCLFVEWPCDAFSCDVKHVFKDTVKLRNELFITNMFSSICK